MGIQWKVLHKDDLCLQLPKYTLLIAGFIAYVIYSYESDEKTEYLLKKKMETSAKEKTEILNFLPDGVIIFKDKSP